ncbi:CASP-like protein VIT_17s0000g00560 [Striga asiatica]|uniref:CASP-like protein n=1 Tax=Striga asiatica TaxID=4170 RepID=A0A5A7QKR9_STRAF|nr:CASP-like protein VIT_17s0000g00560 [Striga asiatica]
MASTNDKTQHIIPPLKTHKLLFATQISLRLLAFAATLAATSIMLSTKQTALVFGIQLDARYSYSPAFKFFAFSNLIVCVFTVLSLFTAFILGRKTVDSSTYYFYMFLHDLVMTILLMAGCAAATAVGYIGKYGNSHSGWMAICGYFAKFCNWVTAASILSYFGLFFYFVLTIVTAHKSRQIQIQSS